MGFTGKSLVGFIDWLHKQPLSDSTRVAYDKRVKSLLKSENPQGKIDAIKSVSHKRFSQSAWNMYQQFQQSCTEPTKRERATIVELFRVMKDFDSDLVLSMRLSDKLSAEHPLCYKGNIVFQNDSDQLILSPYQYEILSQFSKNGYLVDIE